MWGEPLLVEQGQGQKPLKLLLFDTEGFEATGKADAYDDRIFALSTILSAVLVYNLPETVRESDMQVSHLTEHWSPEQARKQAFTLAWCLKVSLTEFCGFDGKKEVTEAFRLLSAIS